MPLMSAAAPRANWFAVSVILLALAVRWTGLPLHLALAHYDVVPAGSTPSHAHPHGEGHTHADGSAHHGGHGHHAEADHGHGGHPPHPVAEHAEDPVGKRGVASIETGEPAAHPEDAATCAGAPARLLRARPVAALAPQRPLQHVRCTRGPPRTV